ncbi:EAL domain-containing protein [Gammaproteobacteria bacterium]|nr:EAL domain-containing protein [Gammaproteobacteria bacterium]
MGAAEEAELLHKIGRWVVFQAIKQLAKKREDGGNARLFINVSHKVLTDEEFPPWMSVSLKASRLASDSIVFQLDENDATSYTKQASSLRVCRNCKLSLLLTISVVLLSRSICSNT